jgi:hypothetical protein
MACGSRPCQHFPTRSRTTVNMLRWLRNGVGSMLMQLTRRCASSRPQLPLLQLLPATLSEHVHEGDAAAAVDASTPWAPIIPFVRLSSYYCRRVLRGC